MFQATNSRERQDDREVLERVDIQRGYEDDDIYLLLNHARNTILSSLETEIPVFKEKRSQGGFLQVDRIKVPLVITVMPPLTAYGVGQIASELQEEALCNRDIVPRRLLLPFNLGNDHWVGFIIDIYPHVEEPKKATGEKKIITICHVGYIDPFPEANLTIEQIERRQQLKLAIAKIYPHFYQFKFNTVTLLTQNESHGGGAYTCENLIYAAQHGMFNLSKKTSVQSNHGSIVDIQKSQLAILGPDFQSGQQNTIYATGTNTQYYRNKKLYQGYGFSGLLSFEKERIEKILGLIMSFQDRTIKKAIQQAFIFDEKDFHNFSRKLAKCLFEIKKTFPDMDAVDVEIYEALIKAIFDVEISEIAHITEKTSRFIPLCISSTEALLISIYSANPDPIVAFHKDMLFEAAKINKKTKSKPKHLAEDLLRVQAMIDILTFSKEPPRSILEQIGQIATTLTDRRNELWDKTSNVPWILLEFLPSILSKDCPEIHRDAMAEMILKEEKDSLLLLLKDAYQKQYARYEKLFHEKPRVGASQDALPQPTETTQKTLPASLPTMERYVRHFYEKRNLLAAWHILHSLSENYHQNEKQMLSYQHKVDAIQRALVVLGEALIHVDINSMTAEERAIAEIIKPLRSDLLHVERESINIKLRRLFSQENIAGQRIINNISEKELAYLANMVMTMIKRLESYEEVESTTKFLANIPERVKSNSKITSDVENDLYEKGITFSLADIKFIYTTLKRYRPILEILIRDKIPYINVFRTKILLNNETFDKQLKDECKREISALEGILRSYINKIHSVDELLAKLETVLHSPHIPEEIVIQVTDNDADLIAEAAISIDRLNKALQENEKIVGTAFRIAKQINPKYNPAKSEKVGSADKDKASRQAMLEKIEERKLIQWSNPLLRDIFYTSQLARHLSEPLHEFEQDGSEDLASVARRIANYVSPPESSKKEKSDDETDKADSNTDLVVTSDETTTEGELQPLKENTLFSSTAMFMQLPYKYSSLESALRVIDNLQDLYEQGQKFLDTSDIEFRCASEHKICLIAKFLDRFNKFAEEILETALRNKKESFRLKLEALIDRRNTLSHRVYQDSPKECMLLIEELISGFKDFLLEMKLEILKLIRIEHWEGENSQKNLPGKDWNIVATGQLGDAVITNNEEPELSTSSGEVTIIPSSQLVETIVHGDKPTSPEDSHGGAMRFYSL